MWTAYVNISKLGTFTIKKNFTNKKNYARKRYFLSLLPTPLLPPKHSDVINERPLTKNTLQFWKSNTNTFTHIHNLQLQRTSVTLTKFNHLSFQINSVFDFSAYTIRVKLRLNTNLSYHIAYQESLSPCRRCIYISKGPIVFS